jgi:hypothetical protein
MRLAFAALLLVGSIAPAAADSAHCDVSPPMRDTHKVTVWAPDGDDTDPTRRAAFLAGLAPYVFAVLADYGAGEDSPVVVEVDDDQLSTLTSAGKVEVVDYADHVIFGGTAVDVYGRGRLEPPMRAVKGWKLDAKSTSVVPYAVVPRAPKVEGAWWDGFVAGLAGLGLSIATTAPYTNAYVVEMTAAQAKQVSRFIEVGWVGRVEPLYKVTSGLLGDSPACLWFSIDHLRDLARATSAGGGPDEVLTLDLTVFHDTPKLRATIEAAGGEVLDTRPDRVLVRVARKAIRALAVLPEVALVN